MSSASQDPRAPMRGDIEGLRSVAVLFVLVYHLGVDRLSGGFAGVDVFFVISGFLITAGLLTEAERSGTVSLTKFYARRARRLLPAATVVLVFTALAGWRVLPSAHWEALSSDIAAAALYVVNWALAFRSVDYLAEDEGVSAVQHYWSLSVEEQFYVVIPIMMIALAWLARRRGWGVRRSITVAIAAIVLASFAFSVVHTDASPQTAYFYSTTRAWELGIGSLVACAVPLLKRLTVPVASALAMAGVALIAAAGLVITTSTPWPGSAALVPTVGTAAVIAAGVAHSRTLVGRLLGLRPLVWIGGLSYSIYLWHWPLIILSGYVVDLTRWHKVGLAIASVGFAWLSKKLVEDPIRFGPTFARRSRPTLVMGAAGMALSLVAAGLVWTQAPRLTDRPASAVGAAALPEPGTTSKTYARTPRPQLGPEITRSGMVYPVPAAAPKDIPAYYADDCQIQQGDESLRLDCVYGDPEGDVTVALAGDSKAGQWFDALDRISKAHGWRLELYLKSACGLNPEQPKPDCRAYNDKVMDRLTSREHRVDYVVTSAGRGTSGREDPSEERAFVEGYDSYWRRLEAVGTKIIALSDSPQPGGKGTRYECVEENPDDFLKCAFGANDGLGTDSLRRAVELDSSRTWLDLNTWVCPETPQGQCPVVIGNLLVYRQGSHVTSTYVESMTPIIERLFVEAGILSSRSPSLGAKGS
ncbi:acyltransferase family protein [Intrasporangium sp.]|uniref:acyltransferase family protein n=1 Tax=Intrasporangium sp. TaxID=1925024 RepID=UPI002939FF59|nr:acyltransferase family protein [Intrasporangium sp.]MDV3219806.1 acyltransferase [Intrasporangium sp.]